MSLAFGLTDSEAKTNITWLQTEGGGNVSFTINGAGQVYRQAIEFVYLGGAITADRDLRIETTRRLQRSWACLQRYKMVICDQQSMRFFVEGAVGESRGNRDTTLRLHTAKPEQD